MCYREDCARNVIGMVTAGVVVLLANAPVLGSVIGSDGVTLHYHADAGSGVVLDGISLPGGVDPDFYLAGADLWAVTFRDTGGLDVLITPSSSTSTFTLLESPSAFVATWTGVTAPGLAGESFDVTVSAEAGMGDRVVEFDISIATATPSYALYMVDFPRFRVVGLGAGAEEILSYPYAGGWLLRDPVHNSAVAAGTGVPVVQPGPISMQWLSYYDSTDTDGPVLFAGTRDPSGYSKHYHLGQDAGDNVWTFSVEQFPEGNVTPDGDYASPYPCVLGAVEGDWFDAARFYRSWAVAQPWADKGPMRTSTDFSEIIKSGEMFAVSGPSTDDPTEFRFWPRDIQDQKDYLGVSHIPTHIYGWHNNQFDVDWGDWFPIKPEFVQYANMVADQGNAHAPYFYNMVYSQVVDSYTDSYVPGYLGLPIEPYSLLDENFDIVTAQDTAGQPAVVLCQATDFVEDYTAYIANRLRQESGARGIYLDVFSFGGANRCYDASHGHPVGGGDYYVQSKVNLVQGMRDRLRIAEPEFFVYSEAQSESYIGVIELVYPHHTGGTAGDIGDGRPALGIAPLYSTVYHDYQITGLVAPLHMENLPPDPGLLLIRRYLAAHVFFGYSPWAGSKFCLPSIYDQMGDFQTYEKLLQMIERVMSVMKLDPVRRFAFFGERMRDPVTDAEMLPPIPGDNFLPYQYEQPLTYVSAYKSADRHGLGLLLVNWTDSDDDLGDSLVPGTQSVSYTIRPEDYGLAPGQYLATEYHLHGLASQQVVDEEDIYAGTVTVPERSAAFLRFIRAFDFNADGLVDEADYPAFEACMSGSASGEACDAGDFDGDGDVDCRDWQNLKSAWQGVSDPPDLPGCAVAIPASSRRWMAVCLAGVLAVGVAVIRRRWRVA